MKASIPVTLQRAITAAAMGLLLAGCGGTVQQEYSEQEIRTVTDIEAVREWLAGVSESGQLDSGMTVIDEKIDTLDVPNKDALAEEMDKLSDMRNPSRIRTQAKKMLELLPES